MIKRAAELKPFDVVAIGGSGRIVERVEMSDKPIDSNGATGVRIYWAGRQRPAFVAADKEFEVTNANQ